MLHNVLFVSWIAIILSFADVQFVCLAFKVGELYICQQSILY